MGKKIDAFVLSLLCAGALYLYFYRVFANHAAALLFSGISFVLISRLLKRSRCMLEKSRWLQKRRMRRFSGGTLMHLACADEENAKERLSRLLEKVYGDRLPMELVQLPPSASLTQQAVFALWRQHGGEEKLVICATCTCDGACRSLCASLKAPRIALLDSGALSQLIAEHPEGIFVQETKVKRKALKLKKLIMLLMNRRNAPRCLLFSGIMLLMHLLSAQPGYLLGSIMLLFTALASLHQQKRPAKLF